MTKRAKKLRIVKSNGHDRERIIDVQVTNGEVLS